MTSVRLRALAALLALAPADALLTGSPALAAGPTPAQLPMVKSVTVSKSTVILGSKAGCTSITVTATLSAPMPTTGMLASAVGADFWAPGQSRSEDAFDGSEFTRVGTGNAYRGTLTLCGRYRPGTWQIEAYGIAIPDDFDLTDPDAQINLLTTNKVKLNIALKRPSALTLDATPEPARKGRPITAAGTLKIDGKALSGATVKIYFKGQGASAYAYQGAVTTNSKGAYSKKITATRTGTWEAIYAGTTDRSAASAFDLVAVK